MHLLAACLAAFSLQHAAEAQIITGNFATGPLSGTYAWNNLANWNGATSISNTVTGTVSGATTFVFTNDYAVNSQINISPAAGSSIISFAADTGTRTLTFNQNTGLTGNTLLNSANFGSSLILNLAGGTSSFGITSRNVTINSKITGPGALRILSFNTSSVILTNTTSDWTGGLVVDYTTTLNAVNVVPYGVGYGGVTVNNSLSLPTGTTYLNNISGTTVFTGGGIGGSGVRTLGVISLVSTTYSSVIANELGNTVYRANGDLSLLKLGSGTLTLTQTNFNAYTGATTLSEGVLDIRGIANAGVSGTFSGAASGSSGTTATAGIQVGMNVFRNNLATNSIYSGTITGTSASGFTASTAWNNSGTAGLVTPVIFGFLNPLGISSTAATNLVFRGGQLRYSGSGAGSTNRLFSIGTGGGGIIADGTTGQLLFTGGGTIGFNGQSGARVFTLSGTNTGTNTLTTALADNGGQTALIKSGLGRWVLGGSHAYTGTTRIDSGRLTIGAGASIGSSRTVVVGTAAGSGARLDVTDTAYTFTGGQTLMGSGTVAGGGVAPTTVTINGTLSPGNSPGLLTFDNTSLALGSTGNVIMEISGSTRGTQFDAIDITGGANGGGLTYGGTMTLNFTQTFTSGTFNLFKFDLNETSGAFSSVVFDPASQYTGSWGLVGDVWKVTTNDNKVMEFRKNVEDGGVSYGQLVIVPEPLTLGLLGIGSGVAVVGLRHLRRRKANGANGTSTSGNTADAV